jgi:hypothetical protein
VYGCFGLVWFGSGPVGLVWVDLGCFGSGRVGLVWFGLVCCRSDRVGVGLVFGFCWVGVGVSVGLGLTTLSVTDHISSNGF